MFLIYRIGVFFGSILISCWWQYIEYNHFGTIIADMCRNLSFQRYSSIKNWNVCWPLHKLCLMYKYFLFLKYTFSITSDFFGLCDLPRESVISLPWCAQSLWSQCLAIVRPQGWSVFGHQYGYCWCRPTTYECWWIFIYLHIHN